MGYDEAHGDKKKLSLKRESKILQMNEIKYCSNYTNKKKFTKNKK